ncbi:MAG: IclR family transcriptional regulator [Acidimicrobiales bacterium]
MTRMVPALARGLDILELFLSRDRSLSGPEIAAQLGLPRTTVHELLGTLAARSYLAPAPGQPNRFRLGPRSFELGNRYAERLDLAVLGHAAAQEVAGRCGETVHLAVLDGAEVLYIAKVDSVHAVRMVSAVGGRLPAHCTAVGKMLLSGLIPEELDRRYPSPGSLPAMTPASHTTLAGLRRDLDAIRARGLAHDNCESNVDVTCVAAPVLDHSGRMVAAMSISVPTSRWSRRPCREWDELVAAGATTLSAQLGHRQVERPA